MVKDFTVILSITVVGRVTTNFTTAHSVGLNRVGIFEPVDDVKVVDVLLGDVITAKPIEVIPIAHLILKFTLTLLTTASPNAATVPKGAHVKYVSNSSVL